MLVFCRFTLRNGVVLLVLVAIWHFNTIWDQLFFLWTFDSFFWLFCWNENFQRFSTMFFETTGPLCSVINQNMVKIFLLEIGKIPDVTSEIFSISKKKSYVVFMFLKDAGRSCCPKKHYEMAFSAFKSDWKSIWKHIFKSRGKCMQPGQQKCVPNFLEIISAWN